MKKIEILEVNREKNSCYVAISEKYLPGTEPNKFINWSFSLDYFEDFFNLKLVDSVQLVIVEEDDFFSDLLWW